MQLPFRQTQFTTLLIGKSGTLIWRTWEARIVIRRDVDFVEGLIMDKTFIR